MALLSTQQITAQGAAITLQAAAGGGDAAYPDDRSFFWIKNGGGAPINVTLVVPGTTYGQANPDVVVAVPNGGERMIGPLNAQLADPSDGQVDITYSAVTSVTVALVRI